MEDLESPRRPWDPPWRSRTAHRRLDPDVAGMLVRRRAQLGLTLAEAADEVGCTRRMLAYLEAGQRVPSTALADDLAGAYRLDPDDMWLLTSVALPNVGRDSPYRTHQPDRQLAV